MSEAPTTNPDTEMPADETPRPGGIRRVIPWVLTVLVLAAAGAISYHWMTNQPTAQRRPPKPTAARVDVQPVRQSEETITVSAMGTVVPAREMALASRVAGEVVAVSDQFVTGGRLTPKDVAVKIDPADYDLAVRQREAELARASADVAQARSVILQRQSDVAKADADLVMEQGRRSAALGEYELLGESVTEADKDLVLREPQLKQAKASVASAKASLVSANASLAAAKASEQAATVALEKARLDLARTAIRPPFDAVVLTRNVNVGSNVPVNAALATLVGTEQYWVEISIPADQLQWLRIPGFNSTTGSSAKVFAESAWSSYRTGTVLRLVGQIEPEGRMARVLVAVDDPLDLKAKPDQRRPLILGDYVRVELTGPKLADAIRIDRSSLREGQKVWVMNDADQLEIRDVEIAWSNPQIVLIGSGLKADERLIVSDLGAPVAGMALRASGDLPDDAKGAPRD